MFGRRKKSKNRSERHNSEPVTPADSVDSVESKSDSTGELSALTGGHEGQFLDLDPETMDKIVAAIGALEESGGAGGPSAFADGETPIFSVLRKTPRTRAKRYGMERSDFPAGFIGPMPEHPLSVALSEVEEDRPESEIVRLHTESFTGTALGMYQLPGVRVMDVITAPPGEQIIRMIDLLLLAVEQPERIEVLSFSELMELAMQWIQKSNLVLPVVGFGGI